MIDLMTAIQSLRPNSEWVLRGDELEWLDTTQTQPTESEIQAEVQRLQAEYDANQYQRDRAAEYPAIEDQLDSLWHAIDQGIDLKLSGFYNNNKQVKDTYAKPSS